MEITDTKSIQPKASFEYFFFKELFPTLSKKDIYDLLNIAHRKSYPKNTLLCKEGEINNNVYLIVKGMVRAFYFSDQDIELTPFFWTEKFVASSWESLYMLKPSTLNFETIEKTEAIVVDFNHLKSIIENNFNLHKAYTRILENILSLKLFYVQRFIHEKPEKRYEQFKKDFPEIQHRLSEKHKASYLGITPESFSRLKSRLGE